MKKGDMVELIENTQFYKKGQRAIVMNEFDSYNGNDKNVEIRYEGETYLGGDVDIMPKKLFKVVEN